MGAAVEDDCEVLVIWKRGVEEQAGEYVDLNYIQIDNEINDEFSKVSTFYKKNAKDETFEPKNCEFLLKMRTNYGEQIFASIEYNMAPHVGKTDDEVTINFKDSFFPETFIVVEWTISEETDTKRKTSRLSSSLGFGPAETKVFTQDQIDEFIRQAEELETKKNQLTI